jgi:hypothetical protein
MNSPLPFQKMEEAAAAEAKLKRMTFSSKK